MNRHNINNGEADHMNTQYYLADEVDAELERYETARQEDARRLEQVKGERDVMRSELMTTAKYKLSDGSLCWCDKASYELNPEYGHSSSCRAHRAALDAK